MRVILNEIARGSKSMFPDAYFSGQALGFIALVMMGLLTMVPIIYGTTALALFFF